MKELDFLPQSYHQAAQRRLQLRRNGLLSLLVAACLLGLHGVNQSRLHSAQAALTSLQAGNKAFDNALKLMSNLTERRKRLSEQANLLDRLEDNAPLDVIAAEITRVMPASMAIRRLETETEPIADKQSSHDEGKKRKKKRKDPAPEDRADAPQYGPLQVRLTGIAASDMDVGILYGSLSRSELFADLGMEYSREVMAKGHLMREFQLTLLVKRVAIER